jgi:hypothetical protein
MDRPTRFKSKLPKNKKETLTLDNTITNFMTLDLSRIDLKDKMQVLAFSNDPDSNKQGLYARI